MTHFQVLGQNITGRTSRFFVRHRPPSVYPHVYLTSRTCLFLPGLPPPFLHTVCDQKLEAGTAWERGYTVLVIFLLSFQLPSAPPPPTPPVSLTEPANSVRPRPPTALEQSLASISQFDHTHLGQIGKGTQGKDQTDRLQTKTQSMHSLRLLQIFRRYFGDISFRIPSKEAL